MGNMTRTNLKGCLSFEGKIGRIIQKKPKSLEVSFVAGLMSMEMPFKGMAQQG